jgi:hypothetical protein
MYMQENAYSEERAPRKKTGEAEVQYGADDEVSQIMKRYRVRPCEMTGGKTPSNFAVDIPQRGAPPPSPPVHASGYPTGPAYSNGQNRPPYVGQEYRGQRQQGEHGQWPASQRYANGAQQNFGRQGYNQGGYNHSDGYNNFGEARGPQQNFGRQGYNQGGYNHSNGFNDFGEMKWQRGEPVPVGSSNKGASSQDRAYPPGGEHPGARKPEDDPSQWAQAGRFPPSPPVGGMHEPAIWKIFLDGGPSGDGEWFLMANSDAVEQAYSTWRQQNCVPRSEWHYRDQDGRDFYINFSEMKQYHGDRREWRPVWRTTASKAANPPKILRNKNGTIKMQLHYS